MESCVNHDIEREFLMTWRNYYRWSGVEMSIYEKKNGMVCLKTKNVVDHLSPKCVESAGFDEETYLAHAQIVQVALYFDWYRLGYVFIVMSSLFIHHMWWFCICVFVSIFLRVLHFRLHFKALERLSGIQCFISKSVEFVRFAKSLFSRSIATSLFLFIWCYFDIIDLILNRKPKFTVSN